MSYSHIMCADNEINTGICEYMNTVYVIPKMQPIHKTCSFIFTKLYYKNKGLYLSENKTDEQFE